MLSLQLMLMCFMFGVTSKYMVEGLQCYVCDDCNEYEDFKELHICGEISPVTTMKPVTLPEIIQNPNNDTNSNVKPVHEDTEEYIYDDSMEAHDDDGGKDESAGSSSLHNKKRTKTITEVRTTVKPTTTTKNTATVAPTTVKPMPITDGVDYLEYDLPNADKENVTVKQPITTETTKSENPTTPTNKPTVQQQESTTTLTVSSSSSTSSSSKETSTPSTTLKPLPAAGEDDYLEYDLTNAGEGSNSAQAIPTNKPTVKQPETTTSSATTASTSSSSIETKPVVTSKPSPQTGDEDYLEYDVSNSGESSPSPIKTTVKQEETTTKSSTVPSTSSATTEVPTAPTPDASLTSAKPVQLTDDDDYLEYDVPSSGEQRSIQKSSKSAPISLLKMNEPVCYMIKFTVNNTVVTNRGCTTFINANNYLTCQSLYNGAPMNGCRICSSDGCNKFLSADGSDEDNGLLFGASGVPDKFSVFVILIFTFISSVVV